MGERANDKPVEIHVFRGALKLLAKVVLTIVLGALLVYEVATAIHNYNKAQHWADVGNGDAGSLCLTLALLFLLAAILTLFLMFCIWPRPEHPRPTFPTRREGRN